MKRFQNRAAFLACIIMCYRADRSPESATSPQHDSALIARIVAKAIAYTKSSKATELALCNYNFTETQMERRESTRHKREAELRTELANVGASNMHVALGGDCRGRCGRLVVASGQGDGFGVGFAIYDTNTES